MKLWIARSNDGQLTLHSKEPTWIENYGWTFVSMIISSENFPEVTFENSPQEIELKLMKKKYKIPIPTVNKRYNFYDDGKISFSRHHIAEVLRILTIEDAQSIRIKYHDDEEYWSLYDIYKHTCNEYDYLKLHDEDTDVFVECIIPGYDCEKVYFARSMDGGFFSFDTTGTWMSGRLDVDCVRTRSLYEAYCDDWNYKDVVEKLLLY